MGLFPVDHLIIIFVCQEEQDQPKEKIVDTIANVAIKTTAPGDSPLDLMGEPAMNNAVNICHNIQVSPCNY